MKAEYLSCLVESISEIFSAMLDSETKSGSILMSSARNPTTFINAHISFFGAAEGVVTLSFPPTTATKVARALTNTEGTIPRDMLEDCVVELVGMLVARSSFKELASSPARIGRPCSDSEEVNEVVASSMLEIPFDSNMGPFSLHIGLSPLRLKTPPVGV